MTIHTARPRHARTSLSSRLRSLLLLGAAGTAGLAFVVTAPDATAADTAPVGLGTASSYSVLAGQRVTNTGPSVLAGDLGVAPGTAVTGFPPGRVGGAQHRGDAVALQAKKDLVTAYNDAAGRGPAADQTGRDLRGQRLLPGVYNASSAMALDGTLTLDAQGDPDAVFVFQAGSTLITGSSSRVSLVGGAQACRVYWQVGSSVTLGTGTSFVGTIMALTSATLNNGATLQGRVLARNGQVSLDNNVITKPGCATTTPPSSGSSPTGTPSAVGVPPTSGPTTGGDDDTPSDGSSTGGGTGGGGDDGTNGGSGDGTDSPSDGSTSGSGGGGGTGTGGSDSGSGPVVPRGNPATGAAPGGAETLRTGLLVGAVLCAVGAIAVGSGRRTRPTRSV